MPILYYSAQVKIRSSNFCIALQSNHETIKLNYTSQYTISELNQIKKKTVWTTHAYLTDKVFQKYSSVALGVAKSQRISKIKKRK